MITPLSVANHPFLPAMSSMYFSLIISAGTCPRPRDRPMASISSIKNDTRRFLFRRLKRSRTRAAPTRQQTFHKVQNLTSEKGTPASPATAFANNVFPVPGGPTRSALGNRFHPVSSFELAGFLRTRQSLHYFLLASSDQRHLQSAILTLLRHQRALLSTYQYWNI